MALTRWLLLALVPGLTTVSAQESPHWTAAEAALPAFLREIVDKGPALAQLPELAGAVQRIQTAIAALPGVRFADGGLVTLGGYTLRLDTARSGAAGDGFAIYAWPGGDAAGTRTFVVTGHGEVLATDGLRTPYHATQPPEWHAALAERAPETLASVLTARGTGRDGQMWLPVAKSRSVRAQIQVRGIPPGDERQFTLLVGPASWFDSAHAVPLGALAVPAGIVGIGVGGTAALTGIVAPDLHLVLRAERVLVPGVKVTRTEGGFEVTFDAVQLLAIRCAANEPSAIATLRNISSAQSQCQACSAIDADQDGKGEFGYFGELSGRVALRPGATAKMSPPVLSAAFGNLKGGRVVRSGYVFQMLLPGKDGTWLTEADTGGAGAVAPDAEAAEERWRCYAWPVAYGRSGKRAFVVDERGQVRAWDAEGRFDGEGKPVAADSAYGDDAARWGATR